MKKFSGQIFCLVIFCIVAAFFLSCSGPENKPEEKAPAPPAEKETIQKACLDDDWHTEAAQAIGAVGGNTKAVADACYEACKKNAKSTLNGMRAEGWKVVKQSGQSSKKINLSSVECECVYRTYDFER